MEYTYLFFTCRRITSVGRSRLNTICRTVLIATLLLSSSAISAQTTYREISGLLRLNQTVRGIRSMSNGEHYTILRKDRVEQRSYSDSTMCKTLFGKFADSLRFIDYTLSPDEQLVLLSQGSTPIYRHSFTTRYHLARGATSEEIIGDIDSKRDASFLPNSKKIAFSSRNNLYIYDIADRTTTAVTTDGKWNQIINGTTDWVYEEEFGFTKGYTFSPDSREIAYMKFDESAVPMFEMMRYDGTLYNKAFAFKYPKAGATNSTVELWAYNISDGQSRRIDTGAERDQYIPYIGYTPDGQLYFYRLNRHQNHFEVVLCDADGRQRIIYDERSPRYVERADRDAVTFIDGDRFVVREETSAGYMHLYLHSVKSGRLKPLTTGRWEVSSIVGHNRDYIYYTSTQTSPLGNGLYRVALNGKRKPQRLTPDEGFHTIAPSADVKYYISTYSSASEPNSVAVYDGNGIKIRILAESRQLRDTLRARPIAVKEFSTFITERGDTLNYYIIRPTSFNPHKSYPVLLTQYSGPGSQQVRNRWSLDWEDALVANGYIVACTDTRGTGFRGEAFKKSTYGNLGALEVEDQLSFARYLASKPFIDPQRVGIYGWSYGGFMALGCALKGDGVFKMAIAVAPVTSWRYYDTIYTEVYNGLPQENATGYDDNSPINFASRLDDQHTRLLIIHGTSDDNVHIQNTMEMSRALNREGKQYDMMIYPDQNHSMLPDARSNIREKMIEYTLRNL